MKKDVSRSSKSVPTALLTYVSAISGVISGFFGMSAFSGHGVSVAPLVIFIILAAVSIFCLIIVTRNLNSGKRYAELLSKKNNWYVSILDAIPSPVHVTDENMKWAFMNKAFEAMIVSHNAVKNREEAVGLACCNAGASICNTENCGIKQLHKGVGESYFDWLGKKYKQSTAAIKDKDGKITGYVETVADLTSIVAVNEYTKAEVRRVRDNLKKLAAGDLDLDFTIDEGSSHTEEMRTSFEKISADMKKVKNSIELMTSTAEQLCKAAIGGRLDERADETQHNGEYKKVINGLNRTLDAVVAPITIASDYIFKLSNGEDVEILENNYSGHYSVLIENINRIRNSLYELLAQSRKLAEAGARGDLFVRASSDNLHGGYTRIINGFNDTLDAVLNPINQAIEMLGKMAQNDLTMSMDSEYNGTIKLFADSCNTVRERLLSIQKLMIEISNGDLSSLESCKEVGRRSENDKLMPSVIGMMQTIQDLTNEANTLAEKMIDGDFSYQSSSDKFKGAYNDTVQELVRIKNAVSAPMNEAAAVLSEWEEGRLYAKFEGEYSGIYAKIQDAFNSASSRFCEVIKNISVSASQVAEGSQQIASGSQNLSQGSTEQASSIEELTSTIAEIASQTKENASSAASAKTLSNKVQKEAFSGNDQMKQMVSAMKEINDSSANIAKIIKVIEDIAFQTNILALNAAVEAARAGQAGKGFAVVAEEVRNLAARSAKASNETSQLITDARKKTESGSEIANKTAKDLEIIITGIDEFASLMGKITESSNQQATSISQVDKALSQVSSVVQTNSATSEESAAASEEMSGQAAMLREMVSHFVIDDETNPVKAAELKESPVKPTVKSPVKTHEHSSKIVLNSNNKYGEF